MTRTDVGLGMACAQPASSAIQALSSRRMGAPCAAKITGIVPGWRVALGSGIGGWSFRRHARAAVIDAKARRHSLRSMGPSSVARITGGVTDAGGVPSARRPQAGLPAVARHDDGPKFM